MSSSLSLTIDPNLELQSWSRLNQPLLSPRSPSSSDDATTVAKVKQLATAVRTVSPSSSIAPSPRSLQGRDIEEGAISDTDSDDGRDGRHVLCTVCQCIGLIGAAAAIVFAASNGNAIVDTFFHN